MHIKKTALLIAALMPLGMAMAADGVQPRPRPMKAASAPAKSASASAPANAASRPQSHAAELDQQHARGSKMGECQKLASDQNLNGVERKKFLGTCVNSK